MTATPRRWPPGLIAVLLLAASVAVGLRVWDWPARYDVRDVDEVGYLSSSLCLVEGLPPGYKPAPAGPLIWLGWAWAEAHVVVDQVRPSSAERAAPAGVRVFLGVDRALVDLYRDPSSMRQFIVAANVALSIVAVVAGIAYGWRAGGAVGATLVGGVLASCPLFVEFAVQSRPYAMAWSFGVIALFAASAEPGKRRTFWWTAVLMGLSIGTRVEMLLLVPLLWWEWGRRRPLGRRLAGELLGITTVALFAAYAVAPWLLTGLPGNLRAIATIQLANPSAGGATFGGTLREFAYDDGFGPMFVLFVVAAAAGVWQRRAWRGADTLLIAIVLGLTLTVFKSTGFGLHHKGSALLTLILGSATVVGMAADRRPGLTWIAVLACVALPAARSVASLRDTAQRPAAPLADWVEQHVPDGMTLYTDLNLLKAPLPTADAADRIWGEVTALDAGRRKFAAGLRRFGYGDLAVPRALSDENLVQERGNVRRWYILGDEVGDHRPRYQLRLIRPSPTFGEQDVENDFPRTGGVVLWRPWLLGPPPKAWGPPAVRLTDMDGASEVQVFCSPDIAPRLQRGS